MPRLVVNFFLTNCPERAVSEVGQSVASSASFGVHSRPLQQVCAGAYKRWYSCAKSTLFSRRTETLTGCAQPTANELLGRVGISGNLVYGLLLNNKSKD